MTRSRIVIFLTVAVCITAAYLTTSKLQQRHKSIASMEALPPSSQVRLRGVVTYRDKDQAYLQDETGAIALRVPAIAAAVNAGDSVEISGITTEHYDRRIGPDSAGLSQVVLVRKTGTASLPAAKTGTADSTAANGPVRIRITAKLQAINQSAASSELILSAGSRDLAVTIADHLAGDTGKLINATVAITGNPQYNFDDPNHPELVRLWMAKASDLEVLQPAPASPPLASSVRDLFQETPSGDMVSIRGHVTEIMTDNIFLLSDGQAAISVQIDQAHETQVSATETTGRTIVTQDGL